MTPVTFTRYNPGAVDPTVDVERITHWYLVDYNGNYGTVLVLDTGKELTVGGLPQDIEKKIMEALK